MVFCAFQIAGGMIKTGLGRRLALLFIRAIGRTSLGLAYALVVTDVLLGHGDSLGQRPRRRHPVPDRQEPGRDLRIDAGADGATGSARSCCRRSITAT